MPTFRSEFTAEQFERVLQKWSREFPKFHGVSTDDTTVTLFNEAKKRENGNGGSSVTLLSRFFVGRIEILPNQNYDGSNF